MIDGGPGRTGLLREYLDLAPIVVLHQFDSLRPYLPTKPRLWSWVQKKVRRGKGKGNGSSENVSGLRVLRATLTALGPIKPLVEKCRHDEIIPRMSSRTAIQTSQISGERAPPRAPSLTAFISLLNMAHIRARLPPSPIMRHVQTVYASHDHGYHHAYATLYETKACPHFAVRSWRPLSHSYFHIRIVPEACIT
ncbi:hypothetical protein PsYK624_059850 [Phanerochaete sordida]|uniref:Uncharacterized protein n=1 Tax=Phanerochaete sordida TaxID=48140 RepID=A0A9P3LCS3_9APHY|nr:hypothetical protein PsYK624_059850 [Phanerochaete sordida]